MNVMSARGSWFIAGAGLAFFIVGVVLSRLVEPGVQVEAETLAGDTPALRFVPPDHGPRPVALLAHGVTASKETLFRFGEALAAAGFVCYAIDLPGHGESARPFLSDENWLTIKEVAGTLEAVDVFLGHSMGAYAGGDSVRYGRFNPRLFIAVGALPDLGERGPPLLLLAGQFDEAISLARLRAREDVRLVVSPWSDHALEPYDPRLVNAAVDAACAVVGKAPPAAPTRWQWRLGGMALAVLGALVLGYRLPEVWPRLSRVRGPLLAVIAITAIVLTAGTWLGVAPSLRRAPVQIAAAVFAAAGIVIARKLGVPRWSFAAISAALAVGCLVVGAYFAALLVLLFTLVLFAGTVVGGLAAHKGTRSDGDIAMAIFVGYAIGQWMVL